MWWLFALLLLADGHPVLAFLCALAAIERNDR